MYRVTHKASDFRDCLFPYMHMVPCRCKLVSFIAKSFNKQLKTIFLGIRLYLTLKSLFLVVFTVSSFVIHPVSMINVYVQLIHILEEKIISMKTTFSRHNY